MELYIYIYIMYMDVSTINASWPGYRLSHLTIRPALYLFVELHRLGLLTQNLEGVILFTQQFI